MKHVNQPTTSAKKDAEPRRGHRRLYIAFWIAVGLLLLYCGYRWGLRRAVSNELTTIAAAKQPVSAAQVDAWAPALADDENVAPMLLEAAGKLNSPPTDAVSRVHLPYVGDASVPRRGEPMPDAMKQAIADHLAINQEPLYLLRYAGAIGRARFDLEYEQGLALRLPHLPLIQTGGRLLCLEALARAESGEADSAIQSIIGALGVARCVADEPVLVSQAVRLHVQADALDTIQHVLNRVALSEQQLGLLATFAARTTQDKALFRSILGERALTAEAFNLPAEQVGSLIGVPVGGPTQARVMGFMYEAAGLMDLNQLGYLEVMENYAAAARLPFPQRLDATSAIDQRVAARQASVWGRLRLTLEPAIGRVALVEAKSHALARLAITALAIERYRIRTGEFPARLEDLIGKDVDQMPIDPFDGEVIRYSLTPLGYSLYTCGEDRVDNGGVEYNSAGVRHQPGTDVMFVVER